MALEFPDVSSESSGNLFVKMKDGDSVVMVLRGRLHAFRIHWRNQKASLCMGKEKCAECASGNKPSFRFNVNAIVKDGKEYVVKVWEQGWMIFEQLREYAQEMDLEITPIKVSRKGSGTDTNYVIIPMQKITAEQNDQFRAMKLHDLANLDKELSQPTTQLAQPGQFNEETIPF